MKQKIKNKKAKIPRTLSRKGQEEFLGFGLIIIVVAVILLVFIAFMVKKSSSKDFVESYELESFVQSVLQYTTDCEDNFEYLSLQKLIFDCIDNEKCLDGRKSCVVLNETLENLLSNSWIIGNDSLVKGYEFIIVEDSNEILKLKKGFETRSSKSAKQDFSRGGRTLNIIFTTSY